MTDEKLLRDLYATYGRIQAYQKGLAVEVEALKKLDCTLWQIRAAANNANEGAGKLHEIIVEIGRRIDIRKELCIGCPKQHENCFDRCDEFKAALAKLKANV